MYICFRLRKVGWTWLWALGWSQISFWSIHSGTQTEEAEATQGKLLHKHISSLCSCHVCQYPTGQRKTSSQGREKYISPILRLWLEHKCVILLPSDNSLAFWHSFHLTLTPPIFQLPSQQFPTFFDRRTLF